MESVLVGGGGTLQTGATVSNMDYTIQGHKFNDSVRILPLKQYDIVLGGDWMLQHNLVTFNYITRKVTINHYSKQNIHLDDRSSKRGVQLLSMDKLQK